MCFRAGTMKIKCNLFSDAEPAHRIAGGYEHRCGRRAGKPLPLISKSYRRLKINTRRSKETVGTDMNGKSKSYEIISVDDHESLNRFYEKNDLKFPKRTR